VNDQELPHLKFTVEGYFSDRLLARALYLHQEIRTSKPVGTAIDGPAILQDDDDIGTSVVVLPIRPAIADIGPTMDSSTVFQVDHIEQDARNGGRYVLVRISGEGRHYINSFPDFIEFVYFPLLSGLHKISYHAGIKNLRSIDVLQDVHSDLGYFAFFRSSVSSRSSRHIDGSVH